MNENLLYKLSALLLICVCGISVGCMSLTKGGSAFIKPLDDLQLPGHKLLSVADPADEFELCLETAQAVAADGHAAEAVKLYEKAESLAPAGQNFDLELAPLYSQLGQTERSVRRYREIVAAGQGDASVHNNLAWTLLQANRLVEAEQAVKQGLQNDSSNARLRSTLAVIRYRQGDKEAAFESLEQAYGASAAHHNLAVMELEDQRPEASLAHLEAATRIAGCSPRTIELRDTILAELSKHEGLAR